MSDPTTIVRRMRNEPEVAGQELFGLVYDDLRGHARRLMAQQAASHTLQPTALVHEGFLRLIQQEGAEWNDRAHFMAVAARAMRQVLVDHARGVGAEKRGGQGWQRVMVTGLDQLSARGKDVDVLDLEAALVELGELDPRQATMVEMRFFAAMSNKEIAFALDVHRNTVSRELDAARAWLLHRLGS